MTDKTENLILEHLRHIRGRVDSIDERIGRVEVRLGTLEGHVGHLVQSEAGQNVELDRINRRLERMERRLDLHTT
ncbi:MAG: hypothetical protein ABL898_16090 [Hyphomicrobiaceae bacterium]